MPKTSALEREPEEQAQQPIKTPRKRVWCVVRVVDYRFQALSPSDPADPTSGEDWSDLGADTLLSCEREDMFQLARLHGGLLMSAHGLPSGARMLAVQARVKALETA